MMDVMTDSFKLQRAHLAGSITTLRGHSFRTATIMLAGSSAGYSKSLIEQIGWKGADTGIIIGIITAFVFGMIILLYFYYRNKVISQAEKREMSSGLFKEYVKKAELTAQEAAKIDELVDHMRTEDKHQIFQSIAIFERCIDKSVQRTLGTSPLSSVINDEDMVLSSIRKKLGYNFLPFEHPLVSSRNIEIGQSVSVFSNVNKQPSQAIHAIVVMNQQFALRLKIECKPEEIPAYRQGEMLIVAFARQGDGIYGFDMSVLSFDGGSNLELQHTFAMKRNQLRQFVRIEVNLPLKVRVVQTINEDDKPLQGKQFEAKLVDISGGGLSFLLDRPLVPGEVVSMNFHLNSVVLSGQTGRILKVSLIEGKTSTTYRHHIAFIDIGQTLREKIVKYVFEKQRQINQWR
jgi:c-di-GMP-binding flagellar brake protein YcgR